jgi:5-methyltetrahydropteroyltriglutamate--homocysteine methyltransferase
MAAAGLYFYSDECIFIIINTADLFRGEDRNVERTDIIIANLGDAGIGAFAEGRTLLEAWRAGEIGDREMEERLKEIRIARLLRQQEAGVDWIPVGDHALCDRTLHHAVAFGLAPEPLAEAAGRGPAALARALADDRADEAACRTKPRHGASFRHVAPSWPAGAQPSLVGNPWADAFREARALLAAQPVPVMIGPYTLAKLAGAGAGPGAPGVGDTLERLAPVYAEALRGIGEAGAEWAQLEEPELAEQVAPEHWPLVERMYRIMRDAAPRLRLMLQLTHGAPDDLSQPLALPVDGVGLDFTADGGRALLAVAKDGFPSDRTLGAGIIDGRRVWRSDLRTACALLANLRRLAPRVRLALQPTCGLTHAPTAFPAGLATSGLPAYALATADVKLGELRVLRAALADGPDAVRLDLADSDVLQEMLRVLLPAAVPDSSGPGGLAPARTGAGTRRQGVAGTVSETA